MLHQTEFESLVAKEKADPSVEQTAQEVRAKFGAMFTPEGSASLDIEKFKAFLRPSENHHWSQLNRHSGELTANPSLLRKVVGVLVDEDKPISDRIDEAQRLMRGVPGLGRATITAILQVAYPKKYGVYNHTSSEGLRKIGMHPENSVPRFGSLSLGKQYERINHVLSELSASYGLSLWALDRVWGGLPPKNGEAPSAPDSTAPVPDEGQTDEGVPPGNELGKFALERNLEDFLMENWDKTPLAGFVEILTDPDGEVIGRQFHTSVGPIDFLCKNKGKPGYTVIELKRDRSSDAVVGQVQRYMTAVRLEVAKGEPVSGIIICGRVDDKLRYAVAATKDVSVHTYEVSFALKVDGGLPSVKTGS